MSMESGEVHRRQHPREPAIQRQRWLEPALGWPAYHINLEAWSAQEIKADLPARLARLAKRSKCLVGTETPTRDVERSRILSREGFYPVQARLVLRIDAAHADSLPTCADDRRLRLASSADLATLADMGADWNRHHAGYPIDPELETATMRPCFAPWLERAWRRGWRLYAFERDAAAQVGGFVLFEPTGARTMCLRALAVADASSDVSHEVSQLVGRAVVRCFARGSEIVKAMVPAADLDSVNALLDLGFILDLATTYWHTWRCPTDKNVRIPER